MARGHKFAKLKSINHQNLAIHLILVPPKFPAIRYIIGTSQVLAMCSGLYPNFCSSVKFGNESKASFFKAAGECTYCINE